MSGICERNIEAQIGDQPLPICALSKQLLRHFFDRECIDKIADRWI